MSVPNAKDVLTRAEQRWQEEQTTTARSRALKLELSDESVATDSRSTFDRIRQVQADLFTIREDLRDTLGDAKDARFVRICAEIGALADEFLPEELNRSRYA